MRCLICGHVRTRLDPLPDTGCPACGTSYASAQRQLEAGLIRPAVTEPAKASRHGLGAGIAAIIVLSGVVVAFFLLNRAYDGPSSAPVASQQELSTAMPAAAQPQVVLYTTSWCAVCAKARTYLKRHGIRYTDFDVERDPAAYRAYRGYRGDGVPLIVIGDSSMRGFDERWLRKRLGPWLDRRSN
jgi:glutaredoxin